MADSFNAIILVLEFLYLPCQLAVVAGILSVLEVAEIDILGKDAPILSLRFDILATFLLQQEPECED